MDFASAAPSVVKSIKQRDLLNTWLRLYARQQIAPICASIQNDVGDGDKKLLRYWLDQASQVMVIDPDINPLSLPILEHTHRSPSLLHAVQSIAAAHENYFDPSKLERSLEERHYALSLVRNELSSSAKDVGAVFLTVLMLGMSESWTASDEAMEATAQHLRGLRSIVDIALAQDVHMGLTPFMLGAYLYWDMSCSFLIPSALQVPTNTPEISSAVLRCEQQYHPMGGYAMKMIYIIGVLGRYCRLVFETGIPDDELETNLERELLAWVPNYENRELGVLSDAYRHYGLLNLAALCYRRRSRRMGPLPERFESIWSASSCVPSDDHDTDFEGCSFLSMFELELSIQNRAILLTRLLTNVPASHHSVNFQALPLLAAGSELTAGDCEERELVRKRYRELYSLNHLRENLRALDLLEELWTRRDSGEAVTWFDLMAVKGHSVMLA